MPLTANAINQILPFAPEALEEAGDLLPLAEYKTETMRKRGFRSGLARRSLFNRAHRQSAHMASGLAQFIANRYAPGVVDDADLDKVEEGLRHSIQAMIDAGAIDVSEFAPKSRKINTSAPLTGGGDLSADRTLGINAVAAPTASAVVLRDSAGRAQVAAPSAAADIARKDTVDAVSTSLTTHAALTTAHGSTSAATASAIIQRDASGRAQVAAPSAAADIARKADVDAAIAGILPALREYNAGRVIMWPSMTIPTLADSLPLGLPLDGAIVSLATYPRLARVLCPTANNAWSPAWYRCNSGGTRGTNTTTYPCIKLDDWRGGYPQVLDSGRGMAQATVLMKTTAGSKDITVVNNLSQGGTLLVPLVSADGLYPGMAVSGAGIPAGAVIAGVNGTTVSLSLAATATAASVETTLSGNQLGAWQGDAGRVILGHIGSVDFRGPSLWSSGALYFMSSVASSGDGGRTSWIVGFDSARVVPTAPKNRPAGPVTNAIILI